MDKVINSYETLFIVNCENGEEAVKATVDKFTGLVAENGTVESVNEWGKRRLAYPINDIPEGYYVVVNFKSEADFPAELDRIFNIDENIMRSVIVKIDPKKVAAKEAAVAAEEAANEEETAADAE
ncbi:MAG: 30S ribosomal protein S6 [Clostridia bacterium]|nr:30S ribosomal protein S6 [Clostridia bacterium]MBR6603483.1 30S ribosomal protein S6 [Clostridia bacterium]